ncbi:MAG: hypothetical protein R6X34_10805 [Chloroflexota bacterium]
MWKLVFVILVFISTACSTVSFMPETISVEEKNLPDTITFTGEVIRGQTFEKEISDDLLFRLVPSEYANIGIDGWQINIINKSYPDHELASVATPPFRGKQVLDIVGWHFRNEDNSGPFISGPDGHYQPQEVRSFYFVLTEEDYETAMEAIACIIHPCDDIGVKEAIQIHEEITKARGEVTITDLELGNLVASERAWIENMEFTVELECQNN